MRLYEHLRPVCELCAFEHGPRQLRPFYQAALAEADARALRGGVDPPLCGRDEDAGPPEQPEAEQLAVMLPLAQWLEASAGERDRAVEVWYAIEDLPAGDQQERIRALKPRFLTAALFDLLRDESQALIRDQPQRSRQLAELALTAAQTIDRTLLGAGRGEQLAADAWAWLANARRTACDLKGADDALRRAWDCYEESTGKTLRVAKLLDYEGSLRRDQDRFDEALACLDRALEIYRNAEAQPHLVAKILVNKGTVYYQACQPERAIPVLRHALSLMDSETEPTLLLNGYNNLCFSLCEVDQHDEAARLLPRVEDLCAKRHRRMDHARLDWLRGRVAGESGAIDSAIHHLRSAQRAFLDLASPYDAAVVSLDLASIYADTERRQEMLSLAGTMARLLQSNDLHREAVAALTMLQGALKNKDLPADLIGRLRKYLRQARFNRNLRFDEVA